MPKDGRPVASRWLGLSSGFRACNAPLDSADATGRPLTAPEYNAGSAGATADRPGRATMAPMATRRQRSSQVRPRPPSNGRPVPAKRPTSRPTAPNRLAPHRKIERGSALPIYLRIGLVLVVVALGAVVVFAGVGVLGKVVGAVTKAFDQSAISQVTSTPSPSPSQIIAPNAPILSVPPESYTNQATVDLTGHHSRRGSGRRDDPDLPPGPGRQLQGADRDPGRRDRGFHDPRGGAGQRPQRVHGDPGRRPVARVRRRSR